MGRPQATHPPRPRYLDDRLAYWAKTIPNNAARTYLDRTWTWAQWNDRVPRMAGALGDLGIRRGDVVSFLGANHPACVDLTIAAASLGAANAIVNFRLAGDEVDYAVNDAGAKVLIVGSELMPLVDKIRDRLTAVGRTIEVTPHGGPGDEYESMLADATPAARDADVEPSDVRLVMYSSGTTGDPKGVTLTQANMLAHMINAHAGWCVDDGDKYMVSMPLFHVGGSSWLQFVVYDGGSVVMTRDADIESVSVQFYGLTELCGVITNLLPDEHRGPDHTERLLSAGQVIQQAEVRVVDPETLEEKPANPGSGHHS